MLRYSDFNIEKLLGSLLNESFLYLTPSLNKILIGMKNEIANDIVRKQGLDIKPDITYINVETEKDGYISFTTMRSAVDFSTKTFPQLKNQSDMIDKQSNIRLATAIWDQSEISTNARNLMRLGRFVNTLFPKKYTDKQIEEFVNLFKASVEKTKEKMSIVEGEAIGNWYHRRTYMDSCGSLGNSCMRSHGPEVFNIYIKNPQSCRMLILTEEEKLRGRALIWKIDTITSASSSEVPSFEYFLDRQYTLSDSDIVKFRKYADDQGWAYKTYNNYSSYKAVTYKGKEYELDMTVKAKESDTDEYPYMDTFRRFDPKNGILFNDKDEDVVKNKGHYILESTDGGYEKIGDGVWSDYYDEKIPDGEYVRSEPLDDYIWKNNAIEVTRGRRDHLGWYPEDFDDVSRCSITGEYIHLGDAEWDEESSSYHLRKEYL